VTDVAKHWIDGEWTGSDIVSESINPATGEVLGRWADGGEAEARAAIATARRAFDTTGWSRDRNLRQRALSEMADRFDAHDGFAEGGYKQSGIGRLRGPLAISEFQEAKTVVHAIPPP
jgi:acyl-CoA reductase-like NAD-dependent aldehyde dehydrogenase